ncbi:MAG: response regulator transcription factor [Bacillota bacterium]|nr:response regulator transcription factor [Bacillota bacterium]
MALIYVVEDDADIREIETIALKNGDYRVKGFGSAAEFYGQLEETLPDLVLLDIMLPDEDGYEIVKKLRGNRRTQKLPIIMVTAKTSEIDMVKGLDDGADDYIRKPFSILELQSRVKALIRRSKEEEPEKYVAGCLELDDSRHTVTVDGNPVELTFKEFELLKYLMINKGIVLSREKILRHVWDMYYEGETRTVDMHIKTLRRKLGKGSDLIKTVRNVGYVIQAEEGGR